MSQKSGKKFAAAAAQVEARPYAVEETKAGKVELRFDKTGVIHAPVGKVSFENAKLLENTQTLITAVVKAKPSAAKGKYVKSATLCSTMGPGISLDTLAMNSAK